MSDKKHDDDSTLIEKALKGSQDALSQLLARHQNFIYNIAFKMVLSPYDAEDITQDITIKIITKLSQFTFQSSFRTWIYRITVNQCLTMKKKWLEERYPTFAEYEVDLDSIESQELTAAEMLENAERIEEARLGCLAGMILCLSREQRMIYILGELFLVPHDVGAELLCISKDNFRQRLHRARSDLYQFMDKKCGLIKAENPCRCHKKLKGFIKEGWVDTRTLKFNSNYVKRIYEIVPEKDVVLKKLESLETFDYQQLQRMHPFQEKNIAVECFSNLLQNKELKDLFELGDSK